MIALTSATGKLGSAVLAAILDNKLIDPKELVVCVHLPPSSFPPSTNTYRPSPDLIRPFST
jgi:hypothetical protein